MVADTPEPRELPPELENELAEALLRDPSRRQARIRELIEAHGDLADLLRERIERYADQTVTGPTADATGPEATLQQIGPYTILRRLGEGGMGTVYAAEQKEPFRRLVALKVIKLGMSCRDVLARFELERRALAAMSHDSIARVLDAGTTDRDQPYFVMELVDGLPLTDYCDKHRLMIRERIALFQRICAGVQHAHQKGIIHRDLKPGNILVAREGDRAVPKILDFGLAKATNRDLLAQTIYTQHNQLLGTPEYMAPEQAAMDDEAIDTRADIYSLGVILYQLLCGELPFPSDRMRKAGWLEVRRMLTEEEPSKPSTKISTVGARATEFARVRQVSAQALARGLRGDLDWIVLKALAKEPERRYDSAAGLAMDLQRHLAHEPVEAGPPSAVYRMRKLARRYRGPLIAAATVLVTAIVGALVAWRYAAEASAQTALAEGRATTIGAQKDQLEKRNDEFDMLALVVHLESVRDAEKDLYPAWPEKVPAMRAWLREDWGRLRDKLTALRTTVATLRARSLAGEAEREASRRAHPRFADLERPRRRLATLRRAQDVRDGRAEVVPFALDPDMQNKSAQELHELARPVVRELGRETEGLALARLAYSKARGRGLAVVGHTLAWALFGNGLDDEALEVARAALAAAPGRERAAYQAELTRLQRSIDTMRSDYGRTGITNLAATVASLEAQLTDWRFTNPAEAFLHSTLTELVGELEAFESDEVAKLERRIAWAEQIGRLSVERYGPRWNEARAAIRKADGVVASTLYARRPIDLAPQIGLVPIGMNPATKLWEFYHLRSAWEDVEGTDPAELPIPRHREDGGIEMTGDSGIVFVLLPGGTFLMGAQRTAPDKPNHDPRAGTSEAPVHEVTLDAFFVARHEMTQGQWRRLSGGERPSFFKVGETISGDPTAIDESHPAEQVSWDMCQSLLAVHGMVLPTEAQWEYGARAGTSLPWFSGREPASLDGFANIHDHSSASAYPVRGPAEPGVDDGYAQLAPVGNYRANDWGLHDVAGNVWEWCRDRHGDYDLKVAPGDGMRMGVKQDIPARVRRGGSYFHEASFARSAARDGYSAAARGLTIGLRAARAVR